MFNHAPDGYDCPLCRIVAGEEEGTLTRQEEVVYRTPAVTAFISAHWWPNNPGHAVIVPNQHIENIYDLPARLGADLYEAARLLAIGMKHGYGCDGTSTRQHNEPAGNQDVWHFHLHVFPRFTGDRLYELTREKRFVPYEERAPYAARLKDAIVRLSVVT